jgi:hypothetical protein
MAIDYKKTQKELYQPKVVPSVVDVPEMAFIMIDGRGNPNESPEYQNAVATLYGLSYAIRMNKTLPGYFEYVVPPLEGLWSLDDGGEFKGAGKAIPDKSKFIWTSMIRQPEFATPEVFEAAKVSLGKKKPELDLSLARLERFTEGLCIQVLHIGSYDDEPATVALLDKAAIQENLIPDFTEKRRHHEIYIGDPRKTEPEKLKTVIRHPVRRG